MKKEHKFKVVVLADGRVVVDGVPVTKGQEVEVTIRIVEPPRGGPFRYDDPFGPAVDESEWDASK
jgi:hypothetical protein